MKGQPRHFRCFTMHAERLEVDKTWSHTDDLLGRLERRGGRATLFVHPFSAIEAGADLGPKLRSLVERGHEVGQHTHYYAPRPAGETAKPVSLVDPGNIVRCLDRDLAYLREAGVHPHGFVAGGWVITSTGIDWLQAQGFTYDASVRSFALAYINAGTIAGDRWKRAANEDGVVRLPTTTPVARSFRRGSQPISIGVGRYDLAYIHDYDLLRLRHRMAAASLFTRWGQGPWLTAGEIARLVAAEPLPTA